MSRTFHVCIFVIFLHLIKKLRNFLYASASPGLICGHCSISLQYAAVILCRSPYNWCIICSAVSYPSFGGSCMQFLTISFTSQWYIWSVLWTSTWIFNFLFDSIVKDRHEIEKLQWVSTKHIYIYFWSRLLIHKLAHHFCHINIIISPQIICMLLTLDALDFHGISIMIIVMYGIIVFLQCITSVLV